MAAVDLVTLPSPNATSILLVSRSSGWHDRTDHLSRGLDWAGCLRDRRCRVLAWIVGLAAAGLGSLVEAMAVAAH